jgi:hypothetical protein
VSQTVKRPEFSPGGPESSTDVGEECAKLLDSIIIASDDLPHLSSTYSAGISEVLRHWHLPDPFALLARELPERLSD